MGGCPLNYRKDLMFPFGTYVQATLCDHGWASSELQEGPDVPVWNLCASHTEEREPTNTNVQGPIDAIYLRPIMNDQVDMRE